MYRQVRTLSQAFSEKECPTPLLRNGAQESNSPESGMETVDDGRLPRGRISTPEKAKQVSWLAARLTLCAFPSRIARNSGLCRFQRRSQLRGSNGFFPHPIIRGCEESPFSLRGPTVGNNSASRIQLLESLISSSSRTLISRSDFCDMYSNDRRKSRHFVGVGPLRPTAGLA